MICKVLYFDPTSGAYAGREYTYLTELPVVRYTKVLVPVATSSELQKAIITQVNLPPSVIDPAWADRVLTIERYDK
jgi:hypothetical protein